MVVARQGPGSGSGRSWSRGWGPRSVRVPARLVLGRSGGVPQGAGPAESGAEGQARRRQNTIGSPQ
eukprot:10625170-Lingulodinium_polyedra.AAC.1